METVVKVADRQPLLDDVVAAGKQVGILSSNRYTQMIHKEMTSARMCDVLFFSFHVS